jgi:hypothetical protein
MSRNTHGSIDGEFEPVAGKATFTAVFFSTDTLAGPATDSASTVATLCVRTSVTAIDSGITANLTMLSSVPVDRRITIVTG